MPAKLPMCVLHWVELPGGDSRPMKVPFFIYALRSYPPDFAVVRGWLHDGQQPQLKLATGDPFRLAALPKIEAAE